MGIGILSGARRNPGVSTFGRSDGNDSRLHQKRAADTLFAAGDCWLPYRVGCVAHWRVFTAESC